MDKAFMKDFYQKFYLCPSSEAVKESEEYRNKYQIRSELEDQFTEMIGGTDTEEYKLFDKFLSALYDEYEILLEKMYLLGASDRERMLR